MLCQRTADHHAGNKMEKFQDFKSRSKFLTLHKSSTVLRKVDKLYRDSGAIINARGVVFLPSIDHIIFVSLTSFHQIDYYYTYQWMNAVRSQVHCKPPMHTSGYYIHD